MKGQNRFVWFPACLRNPSIYQSFFPTTQEFCCLVGLETPFLHADISAPEVKELKAGPCFFWKCAAPGAIQLSSLWCEPLYHQLLACTVLLWPLCFTSVIKKLDLGFSQVPRNLIFSLSFPLVQVYQCWAAANSGIRGLNAAGLTQKWKG